jgi:hypothetical protein
MTMLWIAQASEGAAAVEYFFGHLHMVVSAILFRAAFYFSKRGAFSKTIFYFFGK